jgi:hypothetical protein
MRVANRERLRTLCLMAATFFLPFGYDVVFKAVYDGTGSYWITTSIFYLISACFFGLFFFLSKSPPSVVEPAEDLSPGIPEVEVRETRIPVPD